MIKKYLRTSMKSIYVSLYLYNFGYCRQKYPYSSIVYMQESGYIISGTHNTGAASPRFITDILPTIQWPCADNSPNILWRIDVSGVPTAHSVVSICSEAATLTRVDMMGRWQIFGPGVLRGDAKQSRLRLTCAKMNLAGSIPSTYITISLRLNSKN